MQFLYNIAGVILVILALPVFLLRSLREKGFVDRMKQSFGFLPAKDLAAVANKNCIWVHAASVGEIVAASPLIKEFRLEYPKRPILVSVVTSSGYEMARRIIKDADSIIYFPLDLPVLSSAVVKRIKPSIFMPVETELWPNFLRAARQYRIPVMMVNGRISDKSAKRYHYLRGILKDMIGTVNKFCMQSPIDANYIVQLGADPNLVTVTGNTKFDQTYTAVSRGEKEQLLRELGFENADGILLAGSTHKGEEELLLKTFVKVRAQFPQARLLIAARDVMRCDEIRHLAQSFGFKAVKRTQLLQRPSSGHDIVLLDTIGELGKIYSIGDVVYVGGSMVSHGGHNILEPAAHGKAIIVGENMFNFKDTHALFTKRDACITVQTSEQLDGAVLELFADNGLRERMERESLAIVEENRGAARRSAKLLRELLDNLEVSRMLSPAHMRTSRVENFQTYLYEMVHDESDKGVPAHIIMAILRGFSFIYYQLLELKLRLYNCGFFKRHKLDCCVISIGNITVGGTGKTPTAQRLAADIRDSGYNVVILNRGYRAKWKGEVGVVSDGKEVFMSAAQAGDEAYFLARNLPGIPVLIGPDRAVTGQYAVDKLGAEVVILDDGYQHWQLIRDIDILLIDAGNMFGNEYLLPRGTLREPLSHLDRADVCLLTKVDQADPNACAVITERLRRYNDHAFIVKSVHQPIGFIEIGDWYARNFAARIPITTLQGKKVTAVSAIGNPTSFEQTLYDIGAVIAESVRFPDHHDYTRLEMEEVVMKSLNDNVQAIVITEKDAVKIPQEIINMSRPLPVYVLKIEILFGDGKDRFADFIGEHLTKVKAGKVKQ